MFFCLRKTCLSSGLPHNILPDLPVVCSWTVLLNKNSVLECVRVSVCVCVLTTSACLAALWVLRQAVLCTVSDVIFCLTYACQQEPLVSKAHAPEWCLRVSLCILTTALNQTALSWLMLVFGSRRERRFHRERINNAKGLGTVAVQT